DGGELELPSRELSQTSVPAAAEPDLLEDRGRPPSGLGDELEGGQRLVHEPVDVLRLDDAAKLALRDALEVRVERGPPVVGEDARPIPGMRVVPEVRDVVAREESERRGLARPVRTQEAGDPPDRGHGQSVQAEPV